MRLGEIGGQLPMGRHLTDRCCPLWRRGKLTVQKQTVDNGNVRSWPPGTSITRSYSCGAHMRVGSSRPRDAQSRAWGRSSRRLCAPLATIRNPAPLVTTSVTVS